MSDQVDQLFAQFKAARAKGEAVDVASLVSQVEGVDREELVALIDAHLTRSPRAEWDEAAYERSAAGHVVERVTASLRGQAGTWPSLLPRLRDEAQLKRADLTVELADRLGAPDQREKVASYYHEMEQGTLPASGVSDTVLDALAAIVGATREALRRAGESLGPGPGLASPAAVHARQGFDASEAEPTSAPASPAEPDQIDRLFTGG